MDCKEFQDYISPLVDDQISEDKKREAEKHIERCPGCYFDFKIESLVKKLVSQKVYKAQCPQYLRNKILLKLTKSESVIYKAKEIFKYLYTRKSFQLTFSIILIIILVLIFDSPFENNKEKYYEELIAVVYNNSKELRSHNFPEKTIFTSDHDLVVNFISANGIKTPRMPKTDWQILAAGIESHDKFASAHLLFECEEDTVYMMEFETTKAKYSVYLNFINKLKKDLAGKKFVKFYHSDCLLIFRLEDEIFEAYAMRANNTHAFEELIASLD